MRPQTLFYLACVAVLAGCSSGPSSILIEDAAFLPSGRMSVSLTKQNEAPSAPQNGHAIEASYGGAKGTDSQRLEPGDDPVIFEGITINAPADIDNKYSFRSGEVMYRWRKFFGQSQKWGLEVLGGVAHNIFYVTTTSGALAASQKYNTTGLALGVGGIWRFIPSTSLQVRLTALGSGAENEVAATRFDVHVQHALARNLSVRGGLTTWTVGIERAGSDVRAAFGGPAVALELAF